MELQSKRVGDTVEIRFVDTWKLQTEGEKIIVHHYDPEAELWLYKFTARCEFDALIYIGAALNNPHKL